MVEKNKKIKEYMVGIVSIRAVHGSGWVGLQGFSQPTRPGRVT